jgi:hypothetical protein
LPVAAGPGWSGTSLACSVEVLSGSSLLVDGCRCRVGAGRCQYVASSAARCAARRLIGLSGASRWYSGSACWVLMSSWSLALVPMGVYLGRGICLEMFLV